MKYILTVLLVAMGATPDAPPSRRAVCTYVDHLTAGQWTCARLAAWVRRGGHDVEIPRSLANKLPPEPETTDTGDGAEHISNGF